MPHGTKYGVAWELFSFFEIIAGGNVPVRVTQTVVAVPIARASVQAVVQVAAPVTVSPINLFRLTI